MRAPSPILASPYNPPMSRDRSPLFPSRPGWPACALLLMLAAGVGAAAAATGTGEAVKAREQDLTALEAQAQAAAAALAERERTRDGLYAELAQYERDIGALTRAGHDLDALVAEQQSALSGLQARLVGLRADLAEARGALARLLRAAYAMGRGDRLRLLLNQEDPTRVGRVFGYYRALGDRRAAQVREVERLAGELAVLTAEAAAEAERLVQLAERQRQTRLRLEAARASRQSILTGLQASIADERERLATLNANVEALRALIEQLRRKAEIDAEADVTLAGIASRYGQLDWPLERVKLLSPFRGQASAGDLHGDGVLLFAAPGSAVHAVHHGRVVHADWLRGFGLLLVIDHGEGYMSLYGHNESLQKEVGEWVQTGEVIARTGASGGGNDQGLYFALRHQGAPVDPSPWFRRGAG